MRARTLVIVLALGVLVLIRYRNSHSSKETLVDMAREGAVTSSITPGSGDAERNEKPPVQDLTSKESSPEKSAGPNDSKVSSTPLPRLPAYPEMSKLREELTANPHVTPPSLVEFANSLGPTMEAALRADATKEFVESLVQQLNDCVKGENLSMSVRALCYVNLARIFNQHPEFSNADVSRLNVPERLRKLAEPLMNSL